MTWWYVTELTYKGQIMGLRKVDPSTEDTDEDVHYFSKLETIWEHPDPEYGDDQIRYYEDNIFRGQYDFRALITEIFTRGIQ